MSQCESDVLVELLDHYMSVYSEVDLELSGLKGLMEENQYKWVVEYVAGTVLFGYRSVGEYMIVVSPRYFLRQDFKETMKKYLPELDVRTSEERVADQPYIYIHG